MSRRGSPSDFTVVCADLRGYGDSAKPQCLPDHSNYSFRAMAADQLGLMRSLGFDAGSMSSATIAAGAPRHRMALDHPDAVRTLTVMDIVPTYAMFMDTNRHVAGAYWHWYFLSQPEPFPERMIGADPDFFYETCLVGWGATQARRFRRRDARRLSPLLARSGDDPRLLLGLSRRRDASTSNTMPPIIDRKVACPTLVFYGAEWRDGEAFRHTRRNGASAAPIVTAASLPGGHFFVDQFPDETAEHLLRFLGNNR